MYMWIITNMIWACQDKLSCKLLLPLLSNWPPCCGKLDEQLQKYGHLCTVFALEMCSGWLWKRQRPDSSISRDECRRVTRRQSFQRACCSRDTLISFSLQVRLTPAVFTVSTAGKELHLIQDIQKIFVCMLQIKAGPEMNSLTSRHKWAPFSHTWMFCVSAAGALPPCFHRHGRPQPRRVETFNRRLPKLFCTPFF